MRNANLIRRVAVSISLSTLLLGGFPGMVVGADSDDPPVQYAESRGVSVRTLSETSSEDAVYYYETDVSEGSLDGSTWYRVTWDQKVDKATGAETITIKFVGKTYVTSNENEANDWLINQIADLIDSTIAAGGKENSSPNAPQAEVANTVITEVMLPKIMPRVSLPVQRVGGEALKEEQNQGPGPGPVSTHSTNISVDTDSALRYEKTWWNDEYYSNRYGMTLRGQWQWERFSLDVALPIDRVTYQGERDAFDFTRIGLALTPRYNVLSQDVNAPVDVDVSLTTFFTHSFMDKDVEDEPQTIGFGPSIAVRKDFEYLSVGVGSMWMRGYDANGNETGPGEKTYTDSFHTGLHVGVPVGDRWAVNTRMIYNRVARTGDADGDYVTAGLGAVYFLNDTWTLDAEVRSNLGYEHADNASLHIGAAWNF